MGVIELIYTSPPSYKFNSFVNHARFYFDVLLLTGNIPIINSIIRLRIFQMLWKYKGISKPLGKE